MLNDKRVSHIIADTSVISNTTQQSPPWGLDRIDQINLPLNNQYSYGNKGSSVNVFVIDSGIKVGHEQFSGRNIDEENFSIPCPPPICVGPICNRPVMPFGDQTGHGTHVAATIGGEDYGVAKATQLHSIKIFSGDCAIPESIIIEALISLNNRIASNSSLLPAVVNMSYGGGTRNSESENLYQQLTNKGLILVAAAGNSNSNNCGYPARYNNVISVGASTINDSRAGFSNKGSCVNLFAPGEDILSAGIASNSSWKRYSGTSMAAPHVSGAVALYLNDHPNASVTQVKSALLSATSNITLQNAGSGSPSKLLNISQLSPLLNQPDDYDNVDLRGFTDDVPGDAERIFKNASAQTHNFHDNGDEDWTIFAIPHGVGITISTTQLESTSPKLDLYRLTRFPNEYTPNRWDIQMNELILIDSDLSSGNNSVTVQNISGVIRAYVVKTYSDGSYGVNSSYQIKSIPNNPNVTPDQYENTIVRGFTDDVPGDAERIFKNVAAQTHNFHDNGDEDWTIFAIPDGTGITISTTQLGVASAQMKAYKLSRIPNEYVPNRWDIQMNELILIDSDLSSGNNSVSVQNTSGQIQVYVIKTFSSGTYGVNTDYYIMSTENSP